MKKKILIPFILILACFIFSTPSFAASYVASVEGKSYTSFQKAVDSMKSGQTLTVLAEINTKDTVVIKAGKKKISINFAGNKYSYNTKGFAFDIKSGNVTIRGLKVVSKDGVFLVEKNADVVLKSGSATGWNKNKGSLTIDGGKYKTTFSDQDSSDGLVDNYNELVINGGSFSVSASNVICSYKGKVTINGGTFKSTSLLHGDNNNYYYPALSNGKKSTLVINNCSVTSKVCCFANLGKSSIYGGSYCSSGIRTTVVNQGNLTIYNGVFSSKSPERFAIYNYNGILRIEGGEYLQGLANETKGKYYTEINGGKFSSDNGYSAVCNYGGLMKITNGEFYAKRNNAVFNEKGHVKISNGYFKSTKGYYALWNLDKATLAGGTFVTTGGNGKDIGCKAGATIKVSSNVDGQVDYKN